MDPIDCETSERPGRKKYISLDKNENQVFTEQCGKRLLSAVVSAHPNLEVRLLKKDGVINIGWERAIKLEAKQDKTCNLLWIVEFVERLQLNKQAIQDKFDQLCASSGWCL